MIFSSNRRNKRLQWCEWWTKRFGEPVKNDHIIHDNIRKLTTGKGDDYTTGCLLDYVYLKTFYKVIAMNSSKQQALNADPKAKKRINFIGNSLYKRQKKLRIFCKELCESCNFILL